jgi:hypothetical protein
MNRASSLSLSLCPLPLFLPAVCIQIIGRLWASERAEYISKLKQRNIGAAALTGTDYHLHVMVGESSLTRLQEPTAIFEFTTTDPSSGPSVGNCNTSLLPVLSCPVLS